MKLIIRFIDVYSILQVDVEESQKNLAIQIVMDGNNSVKEKTLTSACGSPKPNVVSSNPTECDSESTVPITEIWEIFF